MVFVKFLLLTGDLALKKELTKIQKKILEYIIERRVEKGIPPTLAEIAMHFNYKNRSTVQQHLQAIEKKGFIKRNETISRGIELTLEEKFFIPKPVLGEVAAGNPLTIYLDAIDTIELPTIARMPKDSFLLRVKGNSLKDAYIFNGDVVIVNPYVDVKDGQIVVAILDDAAVVKRFFKRNGTIELASENPEFSSILVNPNYSKFKVVGVVVGIYRSM